MVELDFSASAFLLIGISQIRLFSISFRWDNKSTERDLGSITSRREERRPVSRKRRKSSLNATHVIQRPYMGYISMCDPKVYGFSAVLAIKRVSILAYFGRK